jgi:hypothetical protein
MDFDESSLELNNNKNNSSNKLIGDILKNGQYEILKCIGEGGFGKVFLVKDLKTHDKQNELYKLYLIYIYIKTHLSFDIFLKIEKRSKY